MNIKFSLSPELFRLDHDGVNARVQGILVQIYFDPIIHPWWDEGDDDDECNVKEVGGGGVRQTLARVISSLRNYIITTVDTRNNWQQAARINHQQQSRDNITHYSYSTATANINTWLVGCLSWSRGNLENDEAFFL